MNTLRTLRKLVLGETWVLPLGVLSTLGSAAALSAYAPRVWNTAGPVLLPCAVLLVLTVAVVRSLPPREL